MYQEAWRVRGHRCAAIVQSYSQDSGIIFRLHSTTHPSLVDFVCQARDALRDEEMQEAADTAAAEAAEARRKFLERRKSREDAKGMAKEAQ